MKPRLVYQPVQSISVALIEDAPAYRGIGYDGALGDSNDDIIGVTEIEWVSGDVAQVITLGTCIIETAETIEIGDNVSINGDGKAKVTDAAERQIGRAITGVTGAGYIVIKLVP